MLKVEEILGEEIAEMNNSNLKELKKRVLADEITWILGAGISKGLGVPLWTECLLKMWARIIMLDKVNNVHGPGLEFHKTLDSLKAEIKHPEIFLEKINCTINGKKASEILNGVNTLEAAEYIQNFVLEAIGKNANSKKGLFETAYTSLVKDSLKPMDEPDKILEKLKNQVIGLLACYFVKCVDKNKKVTVISYNFDDLLEFALEKSGLKQEHCFIKNPGIVNVLDNKKGVHIYHPHGTVSVVSSAYSQESKKIVLTESSYEHLEQKAYIWENSVQAKALHDSSCVFLGFSGEDYNFRRIIKNMENAKECQGIRHYLFLSIESLVKNVFKDAVNKKLLGNTARTETQRNEFLSKVSNEQYNTALSIIIKDENMIYEKMLIVKKLYAQYLYWGRHNIIPIFTTRNELPEMVRMIITPE